MKVIIKKTLVLGQYCNGNRFYDTSSGEALVNSKGKIIDVLNDCDLARYIKDGKEAYNFLYQDSDDTTLILTIQNHDVIKVSSVYGRSDTTRTALMWTDGNNKSYITICKNMTIHDLRYDFQLMRWHLESDMSDTINEEPADVHMGEPIHGNQQAQFTQDMPDPASLTGNYSYYSSGL